MKLLRILSCAFLLQFNSVASAAPVSNVGITLVKCATLLTLGFKCTTLLTSSLSSPSDVSRDQHLRGSGVDRSSEEELCPNASWLDGACNIKGECWYGEVCCHKKVPGKMRCERICVPDLICDCLSGEFSCRETKVCYNIWRIQEDPNCQCVGEEWDCD